MFTWILKNSNCEDPFNIIICCPRDVITHKKPVISTWQVYTHGANARHIRATVTAIIEFLYKWMPLHLVCESEHQQSSLNLPCGSEANIMSSQSL